MIIINPTNYAKVSVDALTVWATKVFPLLFPFFILTRLIVNYSESKQNFLDKYFSKLYNAPSGSLLTFGLSTLSGYPMGAKLICIRYDNKEIDSMSAEKMLSFCSVSGPIFMLGTVGVMMFNSFSAGLIIMISNIIASLINGLIYRNRKSHLAQTSVNLTNKPASFSDIVYDSLISILMVGAYIIFSFLIIDILNNLKILSFITHSICCVFKLNSHHDIVKSVLSGVLEITKGCVDLGCLNISLKLKTILASTLIGFGGFCVMLQNLGFVSKLKIKTSTIILQKTTQAAICFVLSFLLCLIFM